MSTVEDWYYVGYSAHLRQRLKDHNNGKVASTKSRRPCTLASCIAVQEKKIATHGFPRRTVDIGATPFSDLSKVIQAEISLPTKFFERL